MLLTTAKVATFQCSQSILDLVIPLSSQVPFVSGVSFLPGFTSLFLVKSKMLVAQRYYYLALALVVLTVSFSFFLFQYSEPVAYNKVVKSPYRSAARGQTRALASDSSQIH